MAYRKHVCKPSGRLRSSCPYISGDYLSNTRSLCLFGGHMASQFKPGQLFTLSLLQSLSGLRYGPLRRGLDSDVVPLGLAHYGQVIAFSALPTDLNGGLLTVRLSAPMQRLHLGPSHCLVLSPLWNFWVYELCASYTASQDRHWHRGPLTDRSDSLRPTSWGLCPRLTERALQVRCEACRTRLRTPCRQGC